LHVFRHEGAELKPYTLHTDKTIRDFHPGALRHMRHRAICDQRRSVDWRSPIK